PHSPSVCSPVRCPAQHRHRPSFPTRRSSDLESQPRPRPVSEAVGPRIATLLEEAPRWTTAKQRLTATRLHQLLRAEGYAVGVTVDRKSTRLNSSHVKISYAVFCLKKKTNRII